MGYLSYHDWAYYCIGTLLPRSEERRVVVYLGVMVLQTPNIVSFRHLPMQTDNVGNLIDSIAATSVMDQDGILRPTEKER